MNIIKMADIFGDPSLFAEFEKEKDSTDAILLSKCTIERKTVGQTNKSNGDLDQGDDSDTIMTDDEESNDSVAVSESNCVHQFETKTGAQSNDLSRSSKNESAEKYETENRRLKNQIKLIDPTKYKTGDEKPMLQVLFMDHRLSRKYRADIEQFVIDLLRKEQTEGEQALPSLKPRPNSVLFGDDEKSMVIGCSQFYEHYYMDSLGWPLVAQTPALTDGWHVPTYEQMYRHSYPCDSDEEEDNDARPPRPKIECFNCGGEHSLNDCTEEKDFRKINERRRQHRQNQGPKQSRYINDPRFTSFKPGVMSDDLRKAMGLKPHQLPPFIYQMRVLGYPPGWLLHAKQEGSGITLFDKDGKEVNVEGETVEDGEVDQELYPKTQYDVSKLIDFPGFNVDPPDGIVDEWKKLRAPPMHPQQRKEVMQVYLSPSQIQQKQTKKRPHSQSSTHSHKKARLDESDMDISGSDEDVDWSIRETTRGTEDECSGPSPARRQRSTSSNQSSRTNTPTLDDLEIHKRELLAQLEESEKESGTDTVELEVIDSVDEESDNEPSSRPPSVTSSTRSTDSPFKPPLPPSPLPTEKPPLPLGTPPPTPPSMGYSYNPPLPPSPLVCTPPPLPKGTPPPSPMTQANTDETGASPVTPRSGSLHMHLGTPVLKEKSPQLPAASKFADGIAQHINFENLPNSTGSYEKMQGLIDKIRQKKYEG